MKKPSIAYALVMGLLRAFGSLPLGFHYGVAGLITRVLRDIVHYRRDVVMINIARSFPSMSYTDMLATADKFYEHLGQIFAEAIWIAGCRNPKRFAKASLVEIEDAGPLNELRERCGDVIILDSHTGNWEMAGALFSASCRNGAGLAMPERDVFVIYRALSSRLWDRVFKSLRRTPVIDKEGAIGLLESAEALKFILEHRGEHKIYDFKTDQYPYGSSARVDVGEFLCQPTTSMVGGASIAHKYHMGVCYMYMGHERRGHYTIRFSKICEDASQMSVEEIMRDFYRRLEADIKAQPYNWLWTHRRWKQN